MNLSAAQLRILRILRIIDTVFDGSSICYENTNWWRSIKPLARKGVITLIWKKYQLRPDDAPAYGWFASITKDGYQVLAK